MDLNPNDQIRDLLDLAVHGDLEDRVMAVRLLGDIGDESSLELLRERMKHVNREYTALIEAVGKLKRKYGER